jgi:hypothetical protein
MNFFTHMYDLFYCTNVNKKGSATVVWIIFPKVYFKKLRIMKIFVSFCFFVRLLIGCVLVTVYKQYT